MRVSRRNPPCVPARLHSRKRAGTRHQPEMEKLKYQPPDGSYAQ
jgi:hypothetical protein